MHAVLAGRGTRRRNRGAVLFASGSMPEHSRITLKADIVPAAHSRPAQPPLLPPPLLLLLLLLLTLLLVTFL